VSDGPSTGTTSAPKWLKLSRRGNIFAAYASADGRSWTPVHVPQNIVLPSSLHVGVLALRSGGTGFARATFLHIGLGRVPDGWTPLDLGAVGALGRTEYINASYNLKAAGTELWGSEDAGHFVYRPWNGDVDLIARVTQAVVPAGSNVALAALSIRESLAPNARHASMAVSTEGKAKFRRRTSVGGSTLSDGPSAGSLTLPRWIRLRRSGHYISAYLSTDGVSWQQVHSTQLIPLSTSVYVGLLGLRSGGSGLADVRFDQVSVR
jgi:regulation of enolase protein 1 (concanavalin A-like superfamily)